MEYHRKAYPSGMFTTFFQVNDQSTPLQNEVFRLRICGASCRFASCRLHLFFLFLGIFLVGEHTEQQWNDHGIHP